MTPGDYVRTIAGFSKLGETEQIRVFAWHLHAHRQLERFRTGDIVACFDAAHEHRPANTSQLLAALVGKELIKDGDGFRLSREFREKLRQKYGSRDETAAVDRLLADLPSRLSDVDQRTYLNEALLCFRHQAFRAAIVMTWNVAYDHLVTTIAARHLPAFNQQMSTMYGGKKKAVASRDDFQRLKESEVIEVCNADAIISREVAKVLSDKLAKRNSAAHPSGSIVDKLQAEAYISDLINNAMLKIR